jgi:hypothetical protein
MIAILSPDPSRQFFTGQTDMQEWQLLHFPASTFMSLVIFKSPCGLYGGNAPLFAFQVYTFHAGASSSIFTPAALYGKQRRLRARNRNCRRGYFSLPLIIANRDVFSIA